MAGPKWGGNELSWPQFRDRFRVVFSAQKPQRHQIRQAYQLFCDYRMDMAAVRKIFGVQPHEGVAGVSSIGGVGSPTNDAADPVSPASPVAKAIEQERDPAAHVDQGGGR